MVPRSAQLEDLGVAGGGVARVVLDRLSTYQLGLHPWWVGGGRDRQAGGREILAGQLARLLFRFRPHRTQSRILWITGALAMGLTMLSAAAQDTQHQQHSAQPQAGGAMGMHGAAMQAAMHRMQENMAMPMSGDPDIDFASMMTPHHQGAIDMAHIELESGKDPELRKMAQKIIEDQEREITAFKEWLAQHIK